MNVKIFIPLDQHTLSHSKQIYCLLNHFRVFSYVSTSTHNSMLRVYFGTAGHLFYHRYTIKVNQMGSTSETTVSNAMHHGDLIQVSLNSTPVGWKILPRPAPNARPPLKAANLSSWFVCLSTVPVGSRGSSVSTESGYELDDRAIKVRSPAEADFSSNLCVQTGSGANPASCTMGTGVLSPGGKVRPERDADHSPPPVPTSWMSRSYISSPPEPPYVCCGSALLL
jgi:hypothetical protein